MSRREEIEAVEAAIAGRRVGLSGWVRANCPICELRLGKSDRKQCLGYNVRSGKFHCFRCGAKGRVDGEFDDLEAETAPEAAPIEPPEGFYFLSDPVARASIAMRPAYDYLATRPFVIDDDLMEEAGIGATAVGHFAGRVIVPVFDLNDQWAWFVGRAWRKKADKPYLYPTGGRRDVLYNPRAVLVDSDEPLLVVEGCMDALAHWPNAVATLGKTSDAVLELLLPTTRPIVLVPDGDAYAEGWAARNRLRLEGKRAGVVQLPPKKDPDEYGREELRAMALASLED